MKAQKKVFREEPARRGSVLIGVLWSLFFLAALAMVINTLITPQLVLAGALRDRVTLHYIAEAGAKSAVIQIRADETDGYDVLNDTWSRNEEAFKEIELAKDRYFSVKASTGEGEEAEEFYGLTDEERRINPNTATAEILSQLFETVGETTSQEALEIAESIIDWRDGDDEPGDNGAESSYYEGLDGGYSCKNANFDVLEELLLVKGVSQDIFDKVKDYMTVYGNGKVNLNTADVPVLRSLGMRETLADKVIQYREGDDGVIGTEDDRVFTSPGDAPLLLSSQVSLNAEENNEFVAITESDQVDVKSDNFRGVSYGSLQDRGISKQIVFVINRDEQIRYWKEM